MGQAGVRVGALFAALVLACATGAVAAAASAAGAEPLVLEHLPDADKQHASRRALQDVQLKGSPAVPKFVLLPVAKDKKTGRLDCLATCKTKKMTTISGVGPAANDQDFNPNPGVAQGPLCAVQTQSYGLWYGVKIGNRCQGPFNRQLLTGLNDIWQPWSLAAGYKCACQANNATMWISTKTGFSNSCNVYGSGGRSWIPEAACRYAEPVAPGVAPQVYYGTVGSYLVNNQAKCLYAKTDPDSNTDTVRYNLDAFEYLCVQYPNY